MATYSTGQAYIQTFRLSRQSTSGVTPGLNTIYSAPSGVEAHIEIQHARIVAAATVGTRTIGVVTATGPGQAWSLLSATSGQTLQFGYTFFGVPGTTVPGNLNQISVANTTRMEPYKFTMVEGDTLTFDNSAGNAGDQYQYDIVVKEFSMP